MSLIEPYFTPAWFTGRKVHLAVCGSISAYKAVELLRACVKGGLRTTVAVTEAAARFVRPLSFSSLGAEAVHTAMFRPDAAEDGGAPGGEPLLAEDFIHLLPGQEADAFVIAPASANMLAKIVAGIADDLVSCQALAWPRPLLIAPAMNTRMWENPATRANCAALAARGHALLAPGSGLLACGEEGPGKLADLREIYMHLLRMLAPRDFAGRRVLLTIGPTRESWDGVRAWSNHSTGVMGSALALAAFMRGAEVTAVCGPGAPWLPSAVRRLDVVAGREMRTAVMDVWPGMDDGIFTAAVADFYPEPFGGAKFKKEAAGEEFAISFKRNPDILAEAGRTKSATQRVVGFAAETDNLEAGVRGKLAGKNADLLVGNLVGLPDSGFGSPTNRVLALDARGRLEDWPVLPKADVAWRILDWLSAL